MHRLHLAQAERHQQRKAEHHAERGEAELPPLPPIPLPLTLLQPNLDELFSATVGQFLRIYRLQTEVQARLEALTPAARPRSAGSPMRL